MGIVTSVSSSTFKACSKIKEEHVVITVFALFFLGMVGQFILAAFTEISPDYRVGYLIESALSVGGALAIIGIIFSWPPSKKEQMQ